MSFLIPTSISDVTGIYADKSTVTPVPKLAGKVVGEFGGLRLSRDVDSRSTRTLTKIRQSSHHWSFGNRSGNGFRFGQGRSQGLYCRSK